MPPPGIEPAIPCFAARPFNHSAIEAIDECEYNSYSTYLRYDTTRSLCGVQRNI